MNLGRAVVCVVAIACFAARDAALPVQAESPDKSTAPKSSTPERPKGTADITFDTIKFEIEKGAPFKRSMLTKPIEELVGRTVRIRGYMLPSFQQSGLTQFVLVRDNLECCFGPGAALYDCIVVDMKPGKSADYTIRPVALEGVFTVRELLDPDGNALAIYHVDGESVR